MELRSGILPDAALSLGAARADGPYGRGVVFAALVHSTRTVGGLALSRPAEGGVVLYAGRRRWTIPFAGRRGDMAYVYAAGGPLDGCFSYAFYDGEGREYPDPHARGLLPAGRYGEPISPRSLRAYMPSEEFSWEGEERPDHSYGQTFGYLIHVRGFTKHSSSKVAHPGTFSGLTEKIPYLQSLGVTTVELQPAYAFVEAGLPEDEAGGGSVPGGTAGLNYWGYTEGYYFAPHPHYVAGEDAAWEFCSMVKALHLAGIELIMQMYFPKAYPLWKQQEALAFWVRRYHVDGFRLLGEGASVYGLADYPYLEGAKLWFGYFGEGAPMGSRHALYNGEFCRDMRRFLKGDGDMLPAVAGHMRGRDCGQVHYLSNFEGFTLWDMLSYDHKHNEANGEEGRDGTDFNDSWNCGAEGESRKKSVRQLRLRQYKNALCLLFFAPGAPLIFMGDEWGNTQMGNNNPYCQDNATAWLDWRRAKAYGELTDFLRLVAGLRRRHGIFRMDRAFRMMDSLSCGYPDLSFHSEQAWRPQMESFRRHIGILYAGIYAPQKDDMFYLGLNMHWIENTLALPKPPPGKLWRVELDTAGILARGWQPGRTMGLHPRSAVLLRAAEEEGHGLLETP